MGQVLYGRDFGVEGVEVEHRGQSAEVAAEDGEDGLDGARRAQQVPVVPLRGCDADVPRVRAEEGGERGDLGPVALRGGGRVRVHVLDRVPVQPRVAQTALHEAIPMTTIKYRCR